MKIYKNISIVMALSLLISLLISLFSVLFTASFTVNAVAMPENLARGKTATVGNFYQNNASFNGEKAIDGNQSTRWATEGAVANHWLTVDMGEGAGQTVNFVKIYEFNSNIKEFKIQSSNDNTTWEDAYVGVTPAKVGNVHRWVECNFQTPVTARYFRYQTVAEASTISIFEFELYNMPELDSISASNMSGKTLKVPQYSDDAYIKSYLFDNISVEATYVGGLKLPVWNWLLTYNIDVSTSGSKNVTINYGGKATTLPVDVISGSISNNIALNKTAEAGSIYQNNPAYAASKAVDGNVTNVSRWVGTKTPETAWLSVDLGQPTDLNVFRFYKFNDCIGEYKFQTSADNVVWQDVYTETLGVDVGNNARWVEHKINTTKSQYVRIKAETLRRDPSIMEFEIYNIPNIQSMSVEKTANAPTTLSIVAKANKDFVARYLSNNCIVNAVFASDEAYATTPDSNGVTIDLDTSLPGNAVASISYLGRTDSLPVKIIYASMFNVGSGLTADAYTEGSKYMNDSCIKAFDNNDITMWTPNGGYTSETDIAKWWIQVDLGEEKEINTIKFKDFQNRTQKYDILYSNDKISWNYIVEDKVKDCAETILHPWYIEKLVTPVTARYFKLKIDGVRMDGDKSHIGVPRIYEFQLLNVGESSVVVNETPYFTDDAQEKIVELKNGKIKANVSVGFDGIEGEKNVRVSCILYDENNTMKDIVTKSYNIKFGESVTDKDFVINVANANIGSYMRVYVWEEEMQPVLMDEAKIVKK